MRMLQITVKEGLCAISSFVFSAWGGLLCSYGNEIELGTKFGELALELLHRFQPREWLARVYCGIYGLINPWSKPERSCCAPLSLAYNVGLETGDIQYAMLSAQLRCFLLFDIGTPLPELKRVMLTLEDEMVATKQEGVLSIAKPFWYMIEAFMHENGVEKFLHDESTTSTDTPVQICWKYFHAMFVTFTFCDFERTSKYANLVQNIVNFPYKDINISFYLLMSSLADIELVRRGNKSRRQVLPRARRHLKKIEMISRFSPNHSFGKQYLLKAELAAINGKHDVAFELFVGAIGFSKGEGLLWEQALGAEICGRFMASRNKMEEAKEYLEEAHSVYLAWGGVGKATALQKDINRLFVVN
mmetsp:Transcript_16747/g.24263  ORF Transcript_16747/g.24263 Transcript_16747/m.24263 type:complete len:359 (+) Transcript_16747:2-1078(+)